MLGRTDGKWAIRFFDMFVGIGGFRSGMEAVGGFFVGLFQSLENSEDLPTMPEKHF